MGEIRTATVCVCLVAGVLMPLAAETRFEGSWVELSVDRPLPAELTHPEGRTTWDLTGLVVAGEPRALRIEDGGSAGITVLGWEPDDASPLRYLETGTGQTLRHWFLPHRDPRLLETRSRITGWTEERDGRRTRFRADRRRVGMGWLTLPSGPREVVLERALLEREEAGLWISLQLDHRWIDPLVGVVATVSGPPTADGSARSVVTSASFVAEIRQGEGSLRVFDFMMDIPPLSRVTYGFDRKGVCTVGGNACVGDEDCVAGGGDICTTPVSVLTPEAHTTIGELVAASSWDFSANDLAESRSEIAATLSPVNDSETCSWDKCGFNRPGVKLGRQDKNFDDPANVEITTTAWEREDRTDGGGVQTDVTLWLRAGIQKEGQTGSLGQGESRICYVDGGRTGVPLWRFPNQDTEGWYWQLGDSWVSDSNPSTPSPDPFQCENTIFVHTCPNSCGLFCPNYIAACDGYSGTQGSTVVNQGPVTLPSGHTFNALLVRNVAEFCVFIGSNCGSPVFRVRTVVYLWEVPWLGTVVRLTSGQDAPDFTSFTTIAETDIKFGLFPPRSLSVGATTDTSVVIDWDPGLDTHRIDSFKVYWSTNSGVFADDDSLIQPAASGNSAQIDGLAPGTEYFFTVTALSSYTNPATLETTTYESLMLPMTAPALPDPIPIEVSATTTGGACTPADEVAGLTVSPAAAGEIEICWNEVADGCTTGYQILGAQSPESAANFSSIVDDTGPTTCRVISGNEGYYLVVARGPAGSGPWGHYGR